MPYWHSILCIPLVVVLSLLCGLFSFCKLFLFVLYAIFTSVFLNSFVSFVILLFMYVNVVMVHITHPTTTYHKWIESHFKSNLSTKLKDVYKRQAHTRAQSQNTHRHIHFLYTVLLRIFFVYKLYNSSDHPPSDFSVSSFLKPFLDLLYFFF